MKEHDSGPPIGAFIVMFFVVNVPIAVVVSGLIWIIRGDPGWLIANIFTLLFFATLAGVYRLCVMRSASGHSGERLKVESDD